MITRLETLTEIFCPECGYDLRAIESARCPECGVVLDRAQLGRAHLPWPTRAAMGRIKAYVRTVSMVIIRPRTVADEVTRPVSMEDAKKFRDVTALIALLGLAALVVWAYAATAGGGQAWPWVANNGMFQWMANRAIPANEPRARLAWLGWMLDAGVVVAAWVGIWLFLHAASAAVGWWFAPPTPTTEQQTRAAAISCYAAAPWALAPLSVLALFTLARANEIRTYGRPAMIAVRWVLLTVACAIPVAQGVTIYSTPLRILSRVTRCGAARMMIAAVALPLTWALLAALLVIGIPAAYLLVAIMLMSVVA